MTELALTSALHEPLRQHLRGRVEQAAFLLADYDPLTGIFTARDLRIVAANGFDIQTSFHISLADETRSSLIKWAWDNEASLVELHSHGDRPPAAFSSSDLLGFEEWVPHLWWRLGGRPYLALVTGGSSFDGLAWIDSPTEARQLDRIVIDDGRVLQATGLTMAALNEVAYERGVEAHG